MGYLGKGEVLTATDLNKFVNKILREIYLFCMQKKSYISYFNLWKMGVKTKVMFIGQSQGKPYIFQRFEVK